MGTGKEKKNLSEDIRRHIAEESTILSSYKKSGFRLEPGVAHTWQFLSASSLGYT